MLKLNHKSNPTTQHPKAAKMILPTNAFLYQTTFYNENKTTLHTTRQSTKLSDNVKNFSKSPPKPTLTKRLKNSLFSVICKNGQNL
jgi:hypothetical protein